MASGILGDVDDREHIHAGAQQLEAEFAAHGPGGAADQGAAALIQLNHPLLDQRAEFEASADFLDDFFFFEFFQHASTFPILEEDRADFVDRPIDLVINDGVLVSRYRLKFGGSRGQSGGDLSVGFSVSSPQAAG